MPSPLEQIYEQAAAGSAGGQSVGIGKTDQAPRASVFSMFDQHASTFNANTNRMFAQMQQHSQQFMQEKLPPVEPPPAPPAEPGFADGNIPVGADVGSVMP